MDIAARHNISDQGSSSGQPMVFAHGFGCDQSMWRLVAPRFADTHRVILFDHVGSGGSDAATDAAKDRARHSSLDGYAQDVLELCRELDLQDVIFVGHCVSAMIGVLAAARGPELFDALVLIAPSPRYMNDRDYVGGFDAPAIDDMLTALGNDYPGWTATISPALMQNPDRPELAEELTTSFYRTDPDIARRLARMTFVSDNRSDLRHVRTPTLVLQCANDVLAPVSAGEYVRDHMPHASMVLLDARGHYPNLSAPDETTTAIQRFLDSLRKS